jgi:hypothetical protein
MPNGDEQAELMATAGWRRAGEVEYEAHLRDWVEARPLVAGAMTAALQPLLPHFAGALSAEDAVALDPAQVASLTALIGHWCGRPHPDWYTTRAYEFRC